MKLICGIFFALSFITLGSHGKLSPLSESYHILQISADEAVEQGIEYQIRFISGIIKDRTEAYIQKEAESCGAKINANVTVTGDNPPVPYAVTLRGNFDASSEIYLSKIIAQDLGIPKEQQTWIRQDIHNSNSS